MQRKLNKHFIRSVCLRDWTAYNDTPFSCTSASKLRSFQYWILLRLFAQIVFWWKWVLRVAVSAFVVITIRKLSNTCFGIVSRYFSSGALHANWIWEVTEIEVDFSLKSVLLRYTNITPCNNVINSFIQVFHIQM